MSDESNIKRDVIIEEDGFYYTQDGLKICTSDYIIFRIRQENGSIIEIKRKGINIEIEHSDYDQTSFGINPEKIKISFISNENIDHIWFGQNIKNDKKITVYISKINGFLRYISIVDLDHKKVIPIKHVGKFWDKDGFPEEYNETDGDMNVGKLIRWYPNFILKSVAEYNSKGIIINEHKNWYSNKNIKFENFYDSDGIKIGTWREWDINGQILSEKTYVKDKVVGESKKWYTSGEILMIENYKDSDNNDILRRKTFYKSGSLKQLIENSLQTEYYPNGSKFSVHTLKEGKLSYEGLSKTFYENGNLQSSGYYKNGSRCGTFILLNRDGEIINAIEYICGVLI